MLSTHTHTFTYDTLNMCACVPASLLLLPSVLAFPEHVPSSQFLVCLTRYRGTFYIIYICIRSAPSKGHVMVQRPTNYVQSTLKPQTKSAGVFALFKQLVPASKKVIHLSIWAWPNINNNNVHSYVRGILRSTAPNLILCSIN